MISKNRLKVGIVNSFGAMGYIFAIFQWMFGVMIYFQFIKLLLPTGDTSNNIEQVAVASSAGPSLPMLIFGGVVLVIMISLSIYYLVKLPSMMVNAGKKAVTKTAKSATPFILKVQHKKDTKKNRNQLTPKLIIVLKLMLITTPMIMIWVSQFYDIDILDYGLRQTVGLLLLDFSLALFFLQYVLARLSSVKSNSIY